MADSTTTATSTTPTPKTYIVEHLDPELGPWSELEYLCVARETQAATRGDSRFVLSSLPPALRVPPAIGAVPAFAAERRGVEDMYPGEEARARVCLLDPQAERDLAPEDVGVFDVFLFGGILGDDPPRDRTSELRKKGYAGRRLGPVQMTTDTAVRVTRMVIEEQYTLTTVPYLDFPELKFNEHESTQMPFRYVKGSDRKPIMPEGMVDLIKKDADKSIDDLF
ncbi:putative duf431 domain-containing protein [Eutypa lata UCREL1]|uniref:Putative duf431 domain-containing protein n=1 Tax=Eutypa lata (strain UCR-EL1) TaxID=1287681 RepID=M7SPZ6_EUTLA|nr:putative duf431 domain-containing protein [Eutypa lata UCREL1]